VLWKDGKRVFCRTWREDACGRRQEFIAVPSAGEQLTPEDREQSFFAIQFLSALADEALLAFGRADGRWFCDLGRIHRKRYTNNVVDLMVVKLNHLSAETQTALCQFACVSATFDLLATVCQTSQDELHGRLWEAVQSSGGRPQRAASSLRGCK
jgi:hypothetical protein